MICCVFVISAGYNEPKMYYSTMKRTAIQLDLGTTVLARGPPGGILASVVDGAVLVAS